MKQSGTRKHVSLLVPSEEISTAGQRWQVCTYLVATTELQHDLLAEWRTVAQHSISWRCSSVRWRGTFEVDRDEMQVLAFTIRRGSPDMSTVVNSYACDIYLPKFPRVYSTHLPSLFL
jgi:hypothetical protein